MAPANDADLTAVLEPDRLGATVFRDDDEAFQLWRKVGIPAERISRLDMADNCWSTSVPGPCGPCSELFYDRGDTYGSDGGPAVNGERFLEIWNLVFMQYERGECGGKDDFPIIGDLAAKSIDTGMSVDRMALILQSADNMCETDLLAPPSPASRRQPVAPTPMPTRRLRCLPRGHRPRPLDEPVLVTVTGSVTTTSMPPGRT